MASGALIYDRREKRRAVAKWSRLVAPLAKEPIASPSQMPRRLTVVVGSPPGDGGFRPAMEMWTEYVRPILAASGLDWEFVQGRREGDVRAAVAERVRRLRKTQGEKPVGSDEKQEAEQDTAQTEDEIILAVRQRNKIAPFAGLAGDIVIGRHTWKEYMRGLHEGWLGPLSAPAHAILPPEPEPSTADGESAPPPKKKPRQIPPYNTPEEYESSPLPPTLPDELAPNAPIPLPHILGFLNTPTRLRRYFNQRALADRVGREVAAVCLAHYREYGRDENTAAVADEGGGGSGGDGAVRELETTLAVEERDWPKRVWKAADEDEKAAVVAAAEAEQNTDAKTSPADDEPKLDGVATAGPSTAAALRPKEHVWTRPLIVDARLAARMRHFELTREDEARAAAIVVPETEVEGWIKGSLRAAWRWAAAKANPPPPKVWAEDE